MVASLKLQDTTAILPEISADELAGLVQQMCGAEPREAARIQRGAGYVLAGYVHATAEIGVYRVLGCDGRIYRTSSGSCDCPDSVQRQVCCKHSWACRLVSGASAIASWNRAQARYELTAKGLAATQAPTVRLVGRA